MDLCYVGIQKSPNDRSLGVRLIGIIVEPFKVLDSKLVSIDQG